MTPWSLFTLEQAARPATIQWSFRGSKWAFSVPKNAQATRKQVVVGSEAEILAGNYHSNIKPKAVMATLCAF